MCGDIPKAQTETETKTKPTYQVHALLACSFAFSAVVTIVFRTPPIEMLHLNLNYWPFVVSPYFGFFFIPFLSFPPLPLGKYRSNQCQGVDVWRGSRAQYSGYQYEEPVATGKSTPGNRQSINNYS